MITENNFELLPPPKVERRATVETDVLTLRFLYEYMAVERIGSKRLYQFREDLRLFLNAHQQEL